MIHHRSVPLSIAVLGDSLPAAAVFSEDVEQFASQVRLPWFNKALGVDHETARLPVFMTSHDILRSWVEDGTGTALGGPGLWVKGDVPPLDLHLGVLVQDLLDLDFHLCMRAFVMS